ncbi:MAG: MscL family protein [Dehalococcoidia bacterium]|jgi:large conductance mechanosensitive channel
MESEGLWADVRRVVLRGDVLGLAVAVVVGTSLYHLFYALFEYVLIPLGRGFFNSESGSDFPVQTPLNSVYRGYTVYWGEALSLVLTLTLALLVAAILRKRLFRPDEEDEVDELPEFREDDGLRVCPECLSEVSAAARRCAFCTTVLKPMPDVPEEA